MALANRTINPIWIQALAVIAVGAMLGLVPLFIGKVDVGLVPIVLAAFTLPFVALIFGNLEKLLLAAILLEMPIRIDKSFFYIDRAEDVAAIGGLYVSLTTICLAGLYALWISRTLGQRTKADLKEPFVSGVRPAMVLYVAISLLSILVARDKLIALFSANLLFQAFLVMVYIAFNMRTRKDIEFLLLVLAFSACLQALIMLFLVATKSSFKIGTIYARVDYTYGMRVAGTIGSPNNTSHYFTSLLAPLLGLMLSRAKRWYKPLIAIVFVLGIVALVVTFSRGGWLGFAISMMVLIFIGWRMGLLPIQVIIFVGFVFVLVFFSFQDLLMARLIGNDSISQNAVEGRIPLLALAVEMIRDHPFRGVGLNNFWIVWDPYLDTDYSGIWLHIVHNKFLLVWAETGIAGIVAFFAFLGTSLFQCWRIIKSGDEVFAPIALGFMGAMFGRMAHMNFDIFNSRADVEIMWVSVGIIAAMFAIIRREELAKKKNLEYYV